MTLLQWLRRLLKVPGSRTTLHDAVAFHAALRHRATTAEEKADGLQRDILTVWDAMGSPPLHLLRAAVPILAPAIEEWRTAYAKARLMRLALAQCSKQVAEARANPPTMAAPYGAWNRFAEVLEVEELINAAVDSSGHTSDGKDDGVVGQALGDLTGMTEEAALAATRIRYDMLTKVLEIGRDKPRTGPYADIMKAFDKLLAGLVDIDQPEVIKVLERPQTLNKRARIALDKSLRRAEQLLTEGHGREAVQETLWLLETVATAFRGVDIGSRVIREKYFNRIVTELRGASPGQTLKRALDWIAQLHGYLSSPTGGGVRHGVDVRESDEMSLSEARLIVNLTRSYVSFLLIEHENLAGGGQSRP